MTMEYTNNNYPPLPQKEASIESDNTVKTIDTEVCILELHRALAEEI
jgi:hypothetical protein